jgi:hypothetical protein
MNYAADNLGYNINRANNGQMLPTTQAEADRTGLQLHEPGDTHSIPSYRQPIKEMLNGLDDWYAMNQVALEADDPATQEELLGRITEIENTARIGLANRDLKLQD